MSMGRLCKGCNKAVAGKYWHCSAQCFLVANSREEPNGCVVWTGSTQGHYGQFSWQGKSRLAHRAAFEIEHGPLSRSQHVCHHCDNPRCIKTAHLFVGTHAQNMADMAAKGRSTRGERSPGAKLSAPQVRRIRASSESVRSLAKEFRVSPSLVSRVRSGHRWAHIV